MDDMKKLAIDTAINGDPNARIYTQALHTITEQAARIAKLEAQLATARGDALPPQEVSVQDIIRERSRQVEMEGFGPDRDDVYIFGQLSRAAASYCAHAAAGVELNAPEQVYIACPSDAVSWPWDRSWWKPTSPRRDLVKAAALIIAEIDRLDRALPEGKV